ncbi:UbiX family flavin prenyltransferase [Maricurvus nonylphenolicus]|uniref:UbiX family flavin prenyltransferase n=1 Tax=Maricurvus nonylphenolicus TaxID=1008307 RepID=UPI0036F39CEF
MSNKRLIVGVSGASGVIYGVRLLELLKDTDIETHLVMSKAARLTLGYETSYSVNDVKGLADEVHNIDDIGASISSGSFKTMGMIIAPCSVKTMSEVATGCTSNLLTRSADVVLKERRRLVMMVRETPMHVGHLRSMLTVSEMGAIVYPPVPAFYAKPQTLEDMVDHSIGRALDLFDIEVGAVRRWNEMLEKAV